MVDPDTERVEMVDTDTARLQLEHNKEYWAAAHRLAIDLHKIWIKIQLIEFAYRMTVLVVGTGFAYMGYRLFIAGIFESASLQAGGNWPLSLWKTPHLALSSHCLAQF